MSDFARNRRVLVVVPTLGRRPGYLKETLTSIRLQRVESNIVIVCPIHDETSRDLAQAFECCTVTDPGNLPAAINAGVASAWQGEEFVSWLNDDDLLEDGSLEATSAMLDRDSSCACAYGSCRYINEAGQTLWLNSAGRWADRILAWGPDLIPQPGMLVRSEAWHAIGGLNESYRFAFDLDLLLRLRKLGSLRDVGVTVSSFRWHADSLTVGDRTQSLDESQRAKRAALSPTARSVAWIWEGPVRLATRIAARRVSARARRIRSATE